MLKGFPLRIFIPIALSAFTASPAFCDLIHQYVFNGDVNDQVVVGGVNGTLVNGATASGGTLTLDGIDDLVRFGNNYLVPTGGADFSLTVQAKFVWGSAQELISQGGSGGPGFYFGPYGSEMRVGDDYGWTPTPFFFGSCGGSCTGVEAPSDGDWHNYAVIVGSGFGQLYIDGVLRATRSGVVYGSGGAFTVLGAQFGGSGEQFNGQVRDLRIYDNAIASQDLTSIFGAPEPGTFVLLAGALLGVGLFARSKRTA